MAPQRKTPPATPKEEWEEVSTEDVIEDVIEEGNPTEFFEPVRYESPKTVEIRIRSKSVEVEERFLLWIVKVLIYSVLLALALSTFLRKYFPV